MLLKTYSAHRSPVAIARDLAQPKSGGQTSFDSTNDSNDDDDDDDDDFGIKRRLMAIALEQFWNNGGEKKGGRGGK